MSTIGSSVKILSSRDPGVTGREGTVIMETARMIVLESAGSRLMVEKTGTAFRVSTTGTIATGDDILGRPEERIGGARR